MATIPDDEGLREAEALIASGRAAEAVIVLEKLLGVNQAHAHAWLMLGQARGMLDQDATAEQAFRAAARLRPDLYEAQFNLALSLMYQERLREAIPLFAEARRLNAAIPGLDELYLKVLLRVLQEESHAAPRPALRELPAEPLVSVIIPTRDRPAMLGDALASLCRQSYGRWEALVINDGGEDVASAVQSVPPALRQRVRLLINSTSQGPARARNRAIQQARGEVLAFLDDDDLYLPEHLETLVRGLRVSGLGFCYTRSDGVWEKLTDKREETSRGRAFAEFRYSPLVLEVRNFIPIDNWAVRRESLAAVDGFDESLACAEDWEWLLRLSRHTGFHEMAEVTAEIRVREDAADSVSKRNRLRPICETIYRRYPSHHPLVRVARELYLAALQ